MLMNCALVHVCWLGLCPVGIGESVSCIAHLPWEYSLSVHE